MPWPEGAVPGILQQLDCLHCQSEPVGQVTVRSHKARGEGVSEASVSVPLSRRDLPPPAPQPQKPLHQAPLCHKIFYWKKKSLSSQERGRSPSDVGDPADLRVEPPGCPGALSGRSGLRQAAGSPTGGSGCVPAASGRGGPAEEDGGAGEERGVNARGAPGPGAVRRAGRESPGQGPERSPGAGLGCRV